MNNIEHLLSDLDEWKVRLSQVTRVNHMMERLGFLEFIAEHSELAAILAELPASNPPSNLMFTDAVSRPIWPENVNTTKDQVAYLWAGIQKIDEANDIRVAGRYIDRSANVPGSISAFYNYLFPPVIAFLRKSLKDQLATQQSLQTPFANRSLSVEEQEEITQKYLHSLAFLHPEVRSVSGGLIRDGHYRQAILDAFIHLIQQVKIKSEIYDKDGVPLMNHVFNKNIPILKISEHPDEQEGVRSLFVGGVMMYRNMPAHNISDQLDSSKAVDILSFASLLFKLLDEASA